MARDDQGRVDVGRLLGRGIAFPPRVEGGSIAWSAGEDNIRESIYIILMTRFNERIRRPDFGGNLFAFLFEPNNVATHRLLETRIEEALAAWEPRISVESVTVLPDPDDPQGAIATIAYRLVATQTQARVSVAVTLAA